VSPGGNSFQIFSATITFILEIIFLKLHKFIKVRFFVSNKQKIDSDNISYMSIQII